MKKSEYESKLIQFLDYCIDHDDVSFNALGYILGGMLFILVVSLIPIWIIPVGIQAWRKWKKEQKEKYGENHE